MLKLQLLSDLHLEFYASLDRLPNIPVQAPVLALLGDIGYPRDDIYKEFLLQCSQRWWKVLIIAGNHEYYGTSIEEANKRIADICALRPNLHFLNNTSLYLPEYHVRFCGSTMWSYIPDDAVATCERSSKDFRKIKIHRKRDRSPSRFTVSDSRRLHKKAVSWLSDIISNTRRENKDRDVKEQLVVLTHHAPTKRHTLLPDLRNTPQQHLDYTDVEYLCGDPVSVWAFGHTHRTSRQEIHGTQVVSNQLGYITFGEIDANFAVDYTVAISASKDIPQRDKSQTRATTPNSTFPPSPQSSRSMSQSPESLTDDSPLRLSLDSPFMERSSRSRSVSRSVSRSFSRSHSRSNARSQDASPPKRGLKRKRAEDLQEKTAHESSLYK